MQSRYRQGPLLWVDLEQPTTVEVQALAAEFNIKPSHAEEILTPSVRSHTEPAPSYLFFVFHFPALRHSHLGRTQEVDFLIGRDFIITTHYELIDPLHKFSKEFEAAALLERNVGSHAGFIFHAMLRKLYGSIEHELEYIRRELAHIEDNIFSERHVEMVQAISNTARDLLSLRQTIEPHRDLLKSFTSTSATVFGSEFARAAAELEDSYYRVHGHIMRQIDFLHELRETNNSLLTTRQNETMRVLTIMAFLTFPLTLLVALFGIGVPGNPLADVPNAFWVIVGGILVLGATMLAYFKHKHWL